MVKKLDKYQRLARRIPIRAPGTPRCGDEFWDEHGDSDAHTCDQAKGHIEAGQKYHTDGITVW